MIKHKNNERIILFEDSDVCWDFEGSDPCLMTLIGKKSYASRININPFPCYHHNFDLVYELVNKVEKIFPIGAKPTYYLLPFDTKGQTNGYADANHYYDENLKNGEQNPIDPYIILAGKRICLHPEMTKYLCSHEYCHHIDYWINFCRGEKHESVTRLDKEVAKLHQIEPNSAYGARKWHTNIGEILVNSIRISVFNIAPDFWPHPCIHPNDSLEIKNFWYEMMLKYSIG